MDAEAMQNPLGLVPETNTFAAYETLFSNSPFAPRGGHHRAHHGV